MDCPECREHLEGVEEAMDAEAEQFNPAQFELEEFIESYSLTFEMQCPFCLYEWNEVKEVKCKTEQVDETEAL